MNRRRILGILGAIVLTLFGTVVLLAYVNSADRRAREGATLVSVLVATDEIPQGMPATEINDRIDVREVPQNARPEAAVTDVSELGNRVAAVDIVPGEQLLASRFVGQDQAQQATSQGLDDPENQQVTIALEAQRAAGGRLSAGQRVGVVASFDSAPATDGESEQGTASSGLTTMLLQQVRVAGVSGGPSEEGQGAGGTVMVSLEVSTGDAERLVFAVEHGRIWLTQQTPETAPGGGTPRTMDTMNLVPGGNTSG